MQVGIDSFAAFDDATKKGMDVQRILAEIASFSIKYEPEIIFVDKKPRKNLFVGQSYSDVYDF
jgi:hypothetical protein